MRGTAEAGCEALVTEGRYSADMPGWLPTLLTWLSPAYPVGGFAYSHGLEWAVEAGEVQDRHTLEDYVATILEAGAGWVDLVLLAAAWRAAGDPAGRSAVIELGAAWRGTAETALEATQQGAAFIAATKAAWPGTALDALDQPAVYPVAIGLACAGRVPLEAALLGYAQALAAKQPLAIGHFQAAHRLADSAVGHAEFFASKAVAFQPAGCLERPQRGEGRTAIRHRSVIPPNRLAVFTCGGTR